MLDNNRKEFYKNQIQAKKIKIKDYKDQITRLNNDILELSKKINER